MTLSSLTNDFVEYFMSNPNIWFNQNDDIDSEICGKYKSLLTDCNIITNILPDYSNKKLFNFIIIFDQLPYYVYRNNETELRRLQKNALDLAILLARHNRFLDYTPEEQTFILLPLRHSNNLSLNEECLEIIKKLRKENDCSIYRRFYKATLLRLGKLYNEQVKPFGDNGTLCGNYDDILDEQSTFNGFWSSMCLTLESERHKQIYTNLKQFYCCEKPTVCVSFSGGVDSIVLLYLLSQIEYINVIAIHINYKNRETSDKEMRFCAEYCQHLEIPLYVRNISEIHRNYNADGVTIDRDIYEDITRKIRFGMYKKLQDENKCFVSLGHNKDDCLENIVSNIVKQKKYENLFGMSSQSIEEGVTITRPFLNVSKSEIYEIAKACKLPFLYDSTPKWCERGMKRDILFPQLNEFDPRILEGLYKMSGYYESVMRVYNDSIQQNCFINDNGNYELVKINDFEHLHASLTHICKTEQMPYFTQKTIRNLWKKYSESDGKLIHKVYLNKYYYFIGHQLVRI